MLDAAAGMGMTRARRCCASSCRSRCRRSSPGLRIATVTIIALATIAVHVDNEGLGVPIHTALSEDLFKTELIAAGGLAIAARAAAPTALLVLAAARAHAVDAARAALRR